MKKTKIFFYSQVIWDDVWQRPQEFAVNGSKDAEIHFMAPVPYHRYMKVHKKGYQAVKMINPSLTVYSPLILPGHYRYPIMKAINEKILIRHIRKLHAKHQFDVFMTNSPFVKFILDKINFPTVVYDVIDDFIEFGWAPKSGRDEEQLLFQKAKVCFTGTNTLYKRKKQFHSDIEFIPCGVHAQKFAAAKGILPADLKSINKPYIGYYGTISDRLNKELIEQIARDIPEANIIMIGPIQNSYGTPVESPNIHYMGLKPHAELPEYLRAFDLCILPFQMDEATKSINPVKLLEFLSGGKIVVSTPIPDIVTFYSDIVFLTEDPSQFVEYVREQLHNPDQKRIQKGLEMAQNQSWANMAKRMLEKL